MRTRCCAATSAGCDTSPLTGPGSLRWHAHTAQALERGLPGHARDSADLAPQADGEEVRHEQAAQARSPADGPEYRPPCRSPGRGESAAGTPPDPWRTEETRRNCRAVHHLGDPARRRYRSGAAPYGPDLAAVPARPGHRDPRSRLPARRHRATEAHIRPGIHRARHAPDAPRRGHRQPDGRVDRAAGPQPRPRPRRAAPGHQVPDPRPRTELHRLIRRRLPGHRYQDPAHRRPGSAHERDLRAARWHPTPRVARPRADPRRTASARRPGRVPDALQHGPAFYEGPRPVA